ncbi:hypothetical protein KUH03_19635 [Sphingobacterium sp. E70]|uniref:hypothetical protein n=1 Tax=Sphingobacterium sp. E70 TaxID=2853439 RepID=UPI00211CA6ED|nr:hypothetical protein [Sphingobacterium sp. E70]ULT28539.1 hypothetical protein KUH03_19635 [Sphingobacterium sp. E70]
MYALIFERLYGLPAKENNTIVYYHLNEQGEIIDYYDLNIDFKFVDIKPKRNFHNLT